MAKFKLFKKWRRRRRKKKGKLARIRRWALRIIGASIVFILVAVLLFRFVNPPLNAYQYSEYKRLGPLKREWVPMDQIAPVMARSVVAAEDANFCDHRGFDFEAIRDALRGGARRGGSTITQQVAKNVYLWHGRSYLRKGLEAGITPLIEALWPKRRILEVYLNIAEFDTGVFGIEAAAKHHFGVPASQLSAAQAARLAVVLPSPKKRSAIRPTAYLKGRARLAQSGAATILADGRADCFTEAKK